MLLCTWAAAGPDLEEGSHSVYSLYFHIFHRHFIVLRCHFHSAGLLLERQTDPRPSRLCHLSAPRNPTVTECVCWSFYWDKCAAAVNANSAFADRDQSFCSAGASQLIHYHTCDTFRDTIRNIFQASRACFSYYPAPSTHWFFYFFSGQHPGGQTE